MTKTKAVSRPRLAQLALAACLVGGPVVLAPTGSAFAQAPGGSQPGASSTGTSSGANASAIQSGQTQLYNATGQNGATPTQDSYKGSIVTGKSTGTMMDLTLDDAIQRGLRQNLGIILQSSSVQGANGQRLEQLQQLLPTVTGSASIEVEQVNLAAYGLKFPGVNPIIGPFQVVDFRAYLTQNVLNIAALQSYIASKHNFAGAKLTAEDARDMVVLTVGNAYLLCIADAARIEAVNAELKTSKVTLDQAVAGHDAGTNPRLDVLRAQVDYQNEQQSLISTANTLAKDKLALARAIGLPLDQPFQLTDTAPFKPLDNLNAETAFTEALKSRKDLQASQEAVKSGEAQRKAAIADQFPVVSVSGDFGDIGETAGHSHGTFTATGQVSAPILQLAKTRGEREVADASLTQAKARLSDEVQQVNADIRDSILDIQSAAKLVDATKSNVDLATEALSEAQQRFHAGISDNLPVSQAQSQFEQANDQYISALYQHNVAKLTLARALGAAQTNYKDYLGGK
ncbi:TolC family protein [Granulicella tundricola]|uniref:Outer membrane efflux protein n=1 Tax=Granulicella tundricola (strain ATCC BAA-1859 / DSM 23138 / MP5ACTX9) TaxID=1198114 RepID=E8WVG4_GRATM|nr:TolC family protein [Granulicella tundricola]ADW68412.1 outer membrane efflux protein [Granulicella tundricola MP5ACTX9]